MWLRFNLILKRFFDICSSACAIVLLMPLWIIVAIAIKRGSDGPVLFKQGRRTKDGRIFKMWKYRSMVVNAENIGSGLFSYDEDPRVTKVGHFLRNTSIDELPQLFNVLMGDISIVGPRPCVTYELGDFDARIKEVEDEIKRISDEKEKALLNFDENISNDIVKEIESKEMPRINDLQKEYDETVSQKESLEEIVKETSLKISSEYEAYIGKEYTNL